MAAETPIEYLRFKWLIPGKIAGAPHPDLCNKGFRLSLHSCAARRCCHRHTLFDRPHFQPNPRGPRLPISVCQRRPIIDPHRISFEVIVFMEDVVDQGKASSCIATLASVRTGTVLCVRGSFGKDPTLLAADAIARVRTLRTTSRRMRWTRFPRPVSGWAIGALCAVTLVRLFSTARSVITVGRFVERE